MEDNACNWLKTASLRKWTEWPELPTHITQGAHAFLRVLDFLPQMSRPCGSPGKSLWSLKVLELTLGGPGKYWNVDIFACFFSLKLNVSRLRKGQENCFEDHGNVLEFLGSNTVGTSLSRWCIGMVRSDNAEFHVLTFSYMLIALLFAGDLSKMKDATFTIAEGCFYQLRISFYVQREIVTGLKYLQQSYRAGIRGM